SLLSQLRDGERELNPALVSLILETVDATRKVLASIEADGTEGPELFEDLTARLRAAQSQAEPASPDDALHIDDSAEPPEARKPEEDAAKTSAVADANIRVG